jgi:hypothetical protein
MVSSSVVEVLWWWWWWCVCVWGRSGGGGQVVARGAQGDRRSTSSAACRLLIATWMLSLLPSTGRLWPPQQVPHLAQDAKQHVSVERPLVRLVHDDRLVLKQVSGHKRLPEQWAGYAHVSSETGVCAPQDITPTPRSKLPQLLQLSCTC